MENPHSPAATPPVAEPLPLGQSFSSQSQPDQSSAAGPSISPSPGRSGSKPREALGPSRRPVLLFVLLVLLAVIAVPAIVARIAEQIQYGITRGELRAKMEVAREGLGKLTETAESFKLVAQSVGPAVVHIRTVERQAVPQDEMSFLMFGQQQIQESLHEGSGIIMDEAGYIVTNYHVVAEATSIEIKLSDSRIVTNVSIVGADPATDLAILKIDEPNLFSAPWGDSTQMEVGDWVLAVGNPFGLERSVTSGIISAKGRREIGTSPLQDFLQTDAAINPGSSGGPLINLKGEVVGITTAIIGEAYQGIGFAIPSEVVKDIYERLKNNQAIERGFLGVQLTDITLDLAGKLGLMVNRGVLVSQVFANSPAEAAGIQPGDVILEWNGREVENKADLTFAVARTQVNSVAKVKLIREGKEITIEVKVGERKRPKTELP